MNGAFYIGATGLDAQQRALEVVANNIANVNTPGFKRAEISFAELAAGSAAADNGLTDTGSVLQLTGVAADAPRRLFTQGPVRQTGSALDLAINGDGFIELVGPGGETLLWRGGTLAVNRDGLLTTSDGTLLKSTITVPQDATDMKIASDGTVSVVEDNKTEPVDIGKIDLVQVRDMTTLRDAGSGLYRVGADDDLVNMDPGTQAAGTFVQGSLEGSNVSLTDEMVSLLVIQRAFAANAQLVQAGDQLMAIANELKR